MPPPGQKEKAVPGVTLDLAQLLPSVRGYYTFEGSLTIPPCSEGVRWFVLKRVMQAKSGEILLFATRYPDNARPTQATHGRVIQQTR
jgi:carbonic anhydrase